MISGFFPSTRINFLGSKLKILKWLGGEYNIFRIFRMTVDVKSNDGNMCDLKKSDRVQPLQEIRLRMTVFN